MKIEEYAKQFEYVVCSKADSLAEGIRIGLKAAYEHIDTFSLADFGGTEEEKDHAVALLSVLATEIEEMAQSKRDLVRKTVLRPGDFVKVRLAGDGVVERVWAIVRGGNDKTVKIEINNRPLTPGFKLGDVIEVPCDYVLAHMTRAQAEKKWNDEVGE